MHSKTSSLLVWVAVAVALLLVILALLALFPSRKPPVPEKPSTPSRELRGIWISRFDYTQSLGTADPDSIQSYLATVFKKLAAANFNTVFFQVRGNADAFYRSDLEPWSHLLSGALGQDPGWDPLDYAIQGAHQNGLELHAWINTFPAWRGREAPIRTEPLHPYLTHPEWLVCDSLGNPMPPSDHYVSFSPGNPEVHSHILQVIDDILSKYDIDGIHFDYIRYPEGSTANGYSHDPVSLRRFKSQSENPLKLDWENWQREQVTQFISKAYNLITLKKPRIIVSAAVLGNYNRPGWNGYYQVYQDAERWAKLHKIDLIIPMTYLGRSNGSFQNAIRIWRELPNVNRPIAAGLGAYRLPIEEVLVEMNDVRSLQLEGNVIFAVSSLKESDWETIKKERYYYPALPPAFSWKATQKPLPPTALEITVNSDSVIFSWTAPVRAIANCPLKKFMLYNSPSAPIDQAAGKQILAIIDRGKREFKLDREQYDPQRIYALSTVDALFQESDVAVFEEH